jgi:formylglycine-generating enzyme required for sulfatase activity
MIWRRPVTFEVALFIGGALLWGLSSLPIRDTGATPGNSQATPQPYAAPAALASYVESIPGTEVKFEMVPIPAGTFVMGSPPSQPHRSGDEGPQHPVTIRAFWMGKAEVTWDEYDKFAFEQGISKRTSPTKPSEGEKIADAITRPTPPYADPTFGFGHTGYPAISMTHHAAMEYTRWLSAKAGKIYRLPTEAEWEYACRAGGQTAYPFGESTAKLGEYSWYKANADARPHPVGQKKHNAWGLFDIEGNVAEWVLDHYDKDYYKTFDPLVPAVGPVLLPTDKEYPYVVRGGSWADDAPGLRCSARRASNEDWSAQDPQLPQSIWWHTDATFVGFRVVRPVEEQENLKGLKSKVKKLD